jgi:hypothetical protein
LDAVEDDLDDPELVVDEFKLMDVVLRVRDVSDRWK